MQADVGVARRSDASAACVAASDKCQREKRKTIMGDDLLWAMTTLGFGTRHPPTHTHTEDPNPFLSRPVWPLMVAGGWSRAGVERGRVAENYTEPLKTYLFRYRDVVRRDPPPPRWRQGAPRSVARRVR
jgi:hypothetical protein